MSAETAQDKPGDNLLVMSGQMEGKVVVISGATGMLGPAVARVFAEAGASLALCSRRQSLLEELAAQLGVPESRVMLSAVDLHSELQTRQWASDVQRQFGRVDAVFHLVGGWRGGSRIEDFPTQDWEWLQQVLVQTTWHMIRAFAPLLQAFGGRFVLVSSPQAQSPSYTNAAYAAGKAAAEALTLALADQLRGTGATANIISVPGIAPFQPKPPESPPETQSLIGAEAIARTMLYLCSPSAAHLSGQRIHLGT